jgi:hypothetical protein
MQAFSLLRISLDKTLAERLAQIRKAAVTL